MKRTMMGERAGSRASAAALMLLLPLIALCIASPAVSGQPTTQPGAPGEPSRAIGADTSLPGQVRHTEADVRFMQRMIVHHAQALEMTALVPERTQRREIRLLANRIELSQVDEIELMQGWLERRGEPVPGAHAEHHRGQAAGQGHPDDNGSMHAHLQHEPMPGMITSEELARLTAARGSEFDRLFLELMIRHHEGALTMVAELFATDGGGQEAEVFNFASHVDSDQRIEIDRMRRMMR